MIKKKAYIHFLTSDFTPRLFAGRQTVFLQDGEEIAKGVISGRKIIIEDLLLHEIGTNAEKYL